MTPWIGATAVAIAALGLPACHSDTTPEDYRIAEAAGTVTVCLQTHTGRACPDQGLLREDVASGEIVRITACAGACFVDECAPAGEYRYGLAEPYVCGEHVLYDTYLYVEAHVTGAPEGCIRPSPAPAPDPGVPWREHRLACPGPGGPDVGPFTACSTGLDGGAGAMLALLGLALRRRRTRRAA